MRLITICLVFYTLREFQVVSLMSSLTATKSEWRPCQRPTHRTLGFRDAPRVGKGSLVKSTPAFPHSEPQFPQCPREEFSH